MSDQEAVNTEQQDLEPTTQENASPTGGDSEQPHEQKVEFSEAQQKVVNDIAAKKAFETREQKRQNEALQAEINALKANTPVEQAPVIPDLPDQYDDNFAERMQQRDAALQAKAKYDAQADYQQRVQAGQQQEQDRLEREALNKSVDDYKGRAQKLGISDSELQSAGGIVAKYGINDDVTRHILSDENGPLITKYLSQNPQAMDTINSLPPINAGLFIENHIKPEAIKFKPQTTNAPDPVETITGAGSPARQRGAAGTYE